MSRMSVQRALEFLVWLVMTSAIAYADAPWWLYPVAAVYGLWNGYDGQWWLMYRLNRAADEVLEQIARLNAEPDKRREP